MQETMPHQQPDTSASDQGELSRSATALVSRNVRIHNRRTSVRLEREMWSALREIATLENCTIHDLCAAVHDTKDKKISFTAALRVFLMTYYRSLAFAGRQVSVVQQKIRSRYDGATGDEQQRRLPSTPVAIRG